MRITRTWQFLLLCLPAVQSSGQVTPAGSLTALRARLDGSLADLSRIVIHENIVRYSACGHRVRRLDTVDTVVEVVDGVEQYAGIWKKGVAYAGIARIGGLWSFGELATLLRNTRDALAEGSFGLADGTPAIVPFTFPAGSHRWYATIASRVYWLEVQGRLSVDTSSGDVSRISWTSAPLPAGAGVDRIVWTVDFAPVQVAGQRFNLPSSAIYKVSRSSPAGASNDRSMVDWNVTTFSDYARYGSEASLVASR